MRISPCIYVKKFREIITHTGKHLDRKKLPLGLKFELLKSNAYVFYIN